MDALIRQDEAVRNLIRQAEEFLDPREYRVSLSPQEHDIRC